MCFSTAQYILLLHESQTTGADRYGTHRCYRAVFPSSSSSCHLPSHFFGDALSYHVIFFSPLQLLTQCASMFDVPPAPFYFSLVPINVSHYLSISLASSKYE